MKRRVEIRILAALALLVILMSVAYSAWTAKPSPGKSAAAATTPPPQTGAPAPMPTASESSDPALTPAPTPPPTPTPTPNSKRLDVPLYNQTELGYPTGCEIVSLAMLINYSVKDPDVQSFVDALVAEMPRDDDPSVGYRGDPASRSGWTILPSALLNLTNKSLGIGSAQDMTGLEMADLKEKLNAGKPVEVWVDGTNWGFGVHALCLTGYDENGFYYNDPWLGKKDVFISFDNFYAIWNTTIYDKVLKVDFGPRIALGY